MILFTSSSMGKNASLLERLPVFPPGVSITFDDGFDFSDTSEYKVYVQCEPPDYLNVIDKIIEHHEFYDLILAWHEKVLSTCPNAVLFPHTETLGPAPFILQGQK